MKKILVLVCVALASFSIEAQIKTPQPSPSSTLIQTVGLTDVTIAYSRPAMRGRTIFGDLVPYGKIWRTGANKNTTIDFSTDVTIDGQELKAGSYAIYTKPGKSSWEVIFYSDTNNWGKPKKWDESKVALKTTVGVQAMPIGVESFMIVIDEISNDAATLGMLWENTYVGVKFEVPTDTTVMENIEKVLNGPSANDYYAAAVYYSSTDKDINKAKEFMDKAMAMIKEPAYWQLRQQSLIQAKAGDKKGAIATAKKSLAAAEAAGNAGYVKMNKESLKEWGAM
ncbi:MAG: dihydrolipoamide dehydrogenase [Maribacter sp.]|nr:MAG: dihydrolipoamide dehydrogenase [Maribacter sp.]